ncbi:MAG: hypothetical protein AAGI23_21165 [Bacteroidota bacterium]
MKLLFTYLLLFSCVILYAQCDQELSKRKTNTPLGYKSRGEYCEGFYRSPTSGNIDSEIFHFTKGKLEYSERKREVLSLGTVSNYNSSINVRATNISKENYYQMDGVIKSGKTLEWDTGKILLKNRYTRRCNNIALFAYKIQSTDDPKKLIYIPLKVGNNDDNYEIKIRASKTLNNIKWRVRGLTQFENLKKTKFSRNYPIEIILPSDIPSGEYKLEVQANDGKFAKLYSILI